jgi:hypothetical protein
MNNKKLLIGVILAVAYIILFSVATTQISVQYPWLLALPFFLIFIANLIVSPNLADKPIKVTRTGVVYFLAILLISFFIMKFREDYEDIRVTATFRIVLAFVLFSSWIYEVRYKHYK